MSLESDIANSLRSPADSDLERRISFDMGNSAERDRLSQAGRSQDPYDIRKDDGAAVAGTQGISRPTLNKMSYSNSTAAPNANPGQLAPPGSRGENPNIDSYEEEVRYTVFGNGQDNFNPDWTAAQNRAYQQSLGDKYDRLMGYEDDRKAREATANEAALRLFNEPSQRAVEYRSMGYSDEEIKVGLDLEYGEGNYDFDRVQTMLERDEAATREAGRNDAIISSGEQTNRIDVESGLQGALDMYTYDPDDEILSEEEYKRREAEGYSMKGYDYERTSPTGKAVDEEATREWFFENNVALEAGMAEIEAQIDMGITPAETVALSQQLIADLEATTNAPVPAAVGLVVGYTFNDYHNRRDQQIAGYDATGTLAPARNIQYVAPNQGNANWAGNVGGAGYSPYNVSNMQPSPVGFGSRPAAPVQIPVSEIEAALNPVAPGSLGEYDDTEGIVDNTVEAVRNWLGRWRWSLD